MEIMLALQIISAIMQHERKYMKKKLTVKQKHRYTHQSNPLYSGKADFVKSKNATRISYIEDGSACKVMLEVNEQQAVLERIGNDLHTKLTFRNKERSDGFIATPYGTIDIQVYTYKYRKKDDVIAIEYDILVNEEVSDGYCMIWNMKEDKHESN